MSQLFPKGYTLVTFADVDSTNEEALRIVRAGMGGEASEKTVIWARSQSNGRGRYGRQWISPTGNLYASILLKPETELRKVAQLSFVAAIAVRQAIAQFAPADSQIQYKWPNDILIQGRKVAGILLESASLNKMAKPEWLIIGIGMNVEHYPHGQQLRTPAACLRQHGITESTEQLLTAIVNVFEQKYQTWQQEGFEPIRQEWNADAWCLGEVLDVGVAGERVTGEFMGIDPYGCMMLKLPKGQTVLLSSAEVFLKEEQEPAFADLKLEAVG